MLLTVAKAHRVLLTCGLQVLAQSLSIAAPHRPGGGYGKSLPMPAARAPRYREFLRFLKKAAAHPSPWT
ncbi:MAG TPA: hypothetical protein VE733_30250, partial [Streptosporangiaceae bacterium]|nr:hypothetical protein [Streptosporangiaceae bacterium]